MSYKQSQFELFPHDGIHPEQKPKQRYVFSNLTLSLEHLIVVCILGGMVMIFSFCLGVEKGKRVAMGSGQESVVEAQEVQEQRPAELPIEKVDNKAEPQAVVEVAALPTNEGESLETVIQEPSSGGIYTVQVASFKMEKSAKKEADTLGKKGYEIFVLPKGKHSIVCVGKFKDRDQAKVVLSELKRKYKDCRVRSL